MKASPRFSRQLARARAWMFVILQIAALVWGTTPALANPTGGTVIDGAAAITAAGNTLTVTQSTDRAIINWQGFSIGANEMTQFVQPGVNSAVLNRVTGGDPSAILGTLQANGQVYLINPNGILVGNGAQINVGAFTASTLDVTNAQFMAGGDLDFQGDSTASVTNYGSIRAIEGDIYLIGAHVANHGSLAAPAGKVGLLAGQHVRLVDGSHPELVVRPSAASLGGTGVHNTGSIEALQAMLAAANGNVYALAINNEGTVRANGYAEVDGRIYLTAPGGKIQSSGELIAKRGQDGGDVVINAGGTEGSSVTVAGSIDVSGAQQGGSVSIRAASVDLLDATMDVSGEQFGTLELLLGENTILVELPVDGLPNPSDPDYQIVPNLTGTPTGNYQNLDVVSASPRDYVQARKSNSSGTRDQFVVDVMGNNDVLEVGHGGIEPQDGLYSSATGDKVTLTPSPASTEPFAGFHDIQFRTDTPMGTTTDVEIIVEGVNGSGQPFQFSVRDRIDGGTNHFRFKDDGSGDVITQITICPISGTLEKVSQIRTTEAPVLPQPPGNVVVWKQTDPAGSPQPFEFTASYYLGTFTLKDGESNDSGPLTSDIYTITESNLLGWELTDILITDPSGGSSSLGSTATIDLAPGETVEVVFFNTQMGQIFVDKITDPTGSTQLFKFEPSYGSNFQLADASTPNDSGYLRPGTYTVKELIGLLPDWDLTNVVGADSVNDSTATVKLDPGETVTLKFFNTQRGQIFVDKITDPSGSTQLFKFEPSYGANFQLTDASTPNDSGYLKPGTYTVKELIGLLPGWDLTNIVGADSVKDSTATVKLDPGETVTLKFFNTLREELGKIIVEKQTVPGGSSQNFSFTPSYPGGPFSLADGQQNNSGTIAAGNYTVEETAQPGWLTAVSITDPTGGSSAAGNLASIGLDPGDIVKVRFTNIFKPDLPQLPVYDLFERLPYYPEPACHCACWYFGCVPLRPQDELAGASSANAMWGTCCWWIGNEFGYPWLWGHPWEPYHSWIYPYVGLGACYYQDYPDLIFPELPTSEGEGVEPIPIEPEPPAAPSEDAGDR